MLEANTQTDIIRPPRKKNVLLLTQDWGDMIEKPIMHDSFENLPEEREREREREQ